MIKGLISFVLIAVFQFSFQAFACEEMMGETEDKSASIETFEGLLTASASPLAGERCSSTSDCRPDENCIRGVCELQGGSGSCLGDIDCALGERCVDGNCRR